MSLPVAARPGKHVAIGGDGVFHPLGDFWRKQISPRFVVVKTKIGTDCEQCISFVRPASASRAPDLLVSADCLRWPLDYRLDFVCLRIGGVVGYEAGARAVTLDVLKFGVARWQIRRLRGKCAAENRSSGQEATIIAPPP